MRLVLVTLMLSARARETRRYDVEGDSHEVGGLLRLPRGWEAPRIGEVRKRAPLRRNAHGLNEGSLNGSRCRGGGTRSHGFASSYGSTSSP